MNNYHEKLFSLPGVIGYGYGHKETHGKNTRKQALVVFVEKKIPSAQLIEEQIIPNSIDGWITDVVEIGKVIAHPVLFDPDDREDPGSGPSSVRLEKIIRVIREKAKDTSSFVKRKTYLLKDITSKDITDSELLASLKVHIAKLNKKAGTADFFKTIVADSEIWSKIDDKFNLNSNFQGLLDLFRTKEKISRTTMIRPARPGLSIGHNRGAAGTFGAVVYDAQTNEPLILSNNHVIANTSMTTNQLANINDAIVQPAHLDGNNSVIGSLAKYAALYPFPQPNTVDCALAKPANASMIDPDIVEIGKVKGVADAVIGMSVKKSGRTTGLTTGKIRALNATIDVNYGENRTIRFEKQIVTTKMSDPGDSGSLVLDRNNHAVGLLFAGSNVSTIVNPIKPVMEILGIRF